VANTSPGIIGDYNLNRFDPALWEMLDKLSGRDQLLFGLKIIHQHPDASFVVARVEKSIREDLAKFENNKGRTLCWENIAELLARVVIFKDALSKKEINFRTDNTKEMILVWPDKRSKAISNSSFFISELVDDLIHSTEHPTIQRCPLLRFLGRRDACRLVACWLVDLEIGYEKRESTDPHMDTVTLLANSLYKDFMIWNRSQRLGAPPKQVYSGPIKLSGKAKIKFGYKISECKVEERSKFSHKVELPLTRWDISAFEMYRPVFEHAVKNSGLDIKVVEANIQQLVKIAEKYFDLHLNHKNLAGIPTDWVKLARALKIFSVQPCLSQQIESVEFEQLDSPQNLPV
jgi:hypothetical protein